MEIPAEQTVIAIAKQLRATPFSLRRVSAELAKLGHFSRSGLPFQAVQIRRMVGEAGALPKPTPTTTDAP